MDVSISKLKHLEREWKTNDSAESQMAILSTDDIIMEDEVAKLLKVTTRTMYNYRKKYKISHFKVGNRVCYSKSLFIKKLNELVLKQQF